MEKITVYETIDPHTGETIETVVIEHSENDFTQMSKTEYDRRQAEQSTPILPPA